MSWDCEVPSLYKSSEPTAAKEHACCECLAKIVKGEKYVLVKAVYDGVFEQWRQHEICAQACEFVRDSDLNDGDCIYFGGLFEWCQDGNILGAYAARKDENVATLRILLAKIKRRERLQKAIMRADVMTPREGTEI